MPKRIMIQCRSNVKKDAVRRESINGVEHIIVSSMTLPDNIVMNRGLYPAEEIDKSFHTLERTLAPVEHPSDSDGQFLSASDPEAIHNFHAGAFNMNVEKVGNRIKVDKYINVQEAQKTDRGRRLLDRINELETSNDPRPIHTSTGIFLEVEPMGEAKENKDGLEYDWIARNMVFDHDAILLDSVGAAQPHQGVGMAVNGDQEHEVQIFALNKVSAAKNLPLADSDHKWDAGEAAKRVREKIGAEDEPNATYGRYHLWFDAENAENFGAYKLPFVDIIDGKAHAVPAALRNAAARLGQTQGPSASEKDDIRGIIDNYLEKLRANAEGVSMTELHQKVFEALEKIGLNIMYIEELFESEVIFMAREELFTVPYRIDNGMVTIVGIPVPVERVVSFNPKRNSKGEAMKEHIINALKAAGIQVNDDHTDEQLLEMYNNMLSANQETGDNSDDNSHSDDIAKAVENALKPVADKLESLEGTINAQAEKDLDKYAETVANSGKFPGLDVDSAKLLGLEKLKEMAANCGSSFGLNPVFNSQSQDDKFDLSSLEMPK